MEAQVIRGAIEVAEPARISGWVYSSDTMLRDKLIMGFVGSRCVGTGKVDIFRKDLLEAKLGDGYCGFDFPVRLMKDENPGALVVRLQNSDAALLQNASRVISAHAVMAPEDTAANLGAVPPASVTWMQDHGWLEQHEHDFLRAVHAAGAYERSLRSTRRAGDETLPMAKPEIVMRNMTGVYMLADVDITRTHVGSFDEMFAEKAALRPGAVSVVGLWSEEHMRVCVAERSHTGPGPGRGRLLAECPAGGIDYQFGPDRILFLHRDCSFAPQGQAGAGGMVMFTGLPKQAGRQPMRPTAVPRAQAAVKAA